MQLLDDLRAEHDLIEQMVGSLRAYVAARIQGEGDPRDADGYLQFFRHFAGTFHHAKEEEVLFRCLIEQAELPAERGPIPALSGEHRRMEGLLQRMEPLLGTDQLDPQKAQRLLELALDYSHALWRHIDAENSVLFPEGQERLRRFHVRELPSRPMTEVERAACDGSTRLLAAHPPLHDAEVHRGDGCIHCPSFGTTCDGLEREWWTDLEWEDMEERMQSD